MNYNLLESLNPCILDIFFTLILNKICLFSSFYHSGHTENVMLLSFMLSSTLILGVTSHAGGLKRGKELSDRILRLLN